MGVALSEIEGLCCGEEKLQGSAHSINSGQEAPPLFLLQVFGFKLLSKYVGNFGWLVELVN